MSKIEHLLNLFTPEIYDLSLDLSPNSKEFIGQVKITGQVKNKSSVVKFHAEDLTITSVTVNQESGDFQHQNDTITIKLPEDLPQKLTVEIEFSGQITDSMTGIYPSYYQHENQDQVILSTQFESHYARQAFPCIDEPAAKAVFNLTITTDAELTVLSNTPVLSQDTKRNRQTVVFESSPKMSPYLLAFVIGDLISKTRLSDSGIKTTVYATQAQSLTSLDFALDIATRAIDWYESYLHVPYPLPKCDHVAIPDFAAGAMENWGLITYREACLLADNTTPITTKETIASIITHELAHMWFGNLVTMKWWDELWLNESLASLLEYNCLDAIEPDYNIWETFYAQSYTAARQRDCLPGVQPILTPISHADEISTIFDGAIVYSKGAVVMRMLENLVGATTFRRALTSYLEKFAYQTASTQDFLSTFNAFSKHNIEQFMMPWLTQAGYPIISVSGKEPTIKLKQQQFGQQSNQRWPIPLTNQLPVQIWSDQTTIVRSTEIDPHVKNLAIINYDDQLIPQITTSLIELSDPIAIYNHLTTQIMLMREQIVPAANLINNLTAFANSDSQLVWLGISRTISNLKLFTDNDTSRQNLRQIVANIIRPKLDELGWLTQAGDDINQLKLRPLITGLAISSRQPDFVDQALKLFNRAGLKRLDNLPANIREQLIGAKLRHDGDLTTTQQLLELYATTQDSDLKDDLSSGLAYSEDTDGIKLILDSLLSPKLIKPQDILSWYADLMANPINRPLAWRWLRTNFDQLRKLFVKNKDYADFIRISAYFLSTARELRQFDDFFKPYRRDRAAKRAIEVGYREIQRRHKIWLNNHLAVKRRLSDSANQ